MKYILIEKCFYNDYKHFSVGILFVIVTVHPHFCFSGCVNNGKWSFILTWICIQMLLRGILY